RLYSGHPVPLDEKGRIRVDDLEMREDVQTEVAKLWKDITTENLPSVSDIEGYRNDFFQLFGFNFEEIDYNLDTSELVNVPSITA
ncbi:MAG: bifunctional NADH-specific enoyl-ACP reductase/trans-2-enoyl-CoA reductase, partial [Sphingobacterium sp.]